MRYETILVDIDSRGIAYITLNRPEKHNAINARMIKELTHAAKELALDEAVRAVVLQSTGKSFCAGGDLGWMQEQAGKERNGKIAESQSLANMLLALNHIPKPLIGKIQGSAFGGGLGMIAVCDVAITVENAKFGLTETRLGLIPATIAPFVVQKLGAGFARQVFFTGKFFGADFAMRSGLAISTPTDQLDEAVESEIRNVLQCAPGAVADAKAYCLRLNHTISDNVTAESAEALADRWETAEAQTGIKAFFNRKPAPWQDLDRKTN